MALGVSPSGRCRATRFAKSSREKAVREPVTGRAVIRGLLVFDPVRMAELVGHDMAQLGVIWADRGDVDLHVARLAGRQCRRTPARILGVRAPVVETRCE